MRHKIAEGEREREMRRKGRRETARANFGEKREGNIRIPRRRLLFPLSSVFIPATARLFHLHKNPRHSPSRRTIDRVPETSAEKFIFFSRRLRRRYSLIARRGCTLNRATFSRRRIPNTAIDHLPILIIPQGGRIQDGTRRAKIGEFERRRRPTGVVGTIPCLAVTHF